MGQVIETLIDDHEKREFFAGLGEDFGRLRADPAPLKDYEDVAPGGRLCRTWGDPLA
jgi:hypothetical protein